MKTIAHLFAIRQATRRAAAALRPITIAALLAAVPLLAGCGGPGGGGDGGDGNELPAAGERAGLAAVDNGAAADVSGIWLVQESVDARACGIGSGGQQYPVRIDQEGRRLVVTAPIDAYPYEAQFSGTITDEQIFWHGEFPEGGGTTTVIELAVAVQGDTFEGTAEWRWTDGAQSCSGTTHVAGSRGNDGGVVDPFAGGGSGGSQSWSSDYAYGGEDGNGFGYVYIPGTGGVTYGD
jgi:hypothetical protein